jgi:hypothetical protein
MERWPILILTLIAISGCTGSQPNPPATTTTTAAVPGRYPVVAGDVEVTIGVGREVIAPPGSATAGSTWVEHTVTYTNRSRRAVWIRGYAQTYPFSGIETRTGADGEWRDYGLGYCGTGAREFQVGPSASHAFTAALPERYVGQEFRVMLPYRTERDSTRWVQAASRARKLGRPGQETGTGTVSSGP